jgi:hypothetical protein
VPRLHQRRLTRAIPPETPMRRLDTGRAAAGALALALLVAAVPALAADPVEPGPWKYRTQFGFNFTQSSYSSNWRGGDTGQFTWVATLDAGAERQFSQKFNLKNVLKVAYGQTGEQISGDQWDTPSKSTDQFLFESLGRFSLGGFVDPYAAINFETQFLDETNPYKALTFNPIKLKESAGIARVWAKDEDREFTSRLGLAVRQTFAGTVVDTLTLAVARSTANDGGAEFVSTMTWPMWEKKLVYKGRLTVYQTLLYSNSDALEEYDALIAAGDPTHEAVADFWQATDVDFENTFTTAITKYLNVNLTIQFVYDKFDVAANVDTSLPQDVLQFEVQKNTRKAGQFRQVLAIGLTYTLF